MKLVAEPSGFHVRKKSSQNWILEGRFDFIPELGDESYSIRLWENPITHNTIARPALSMFVKLPETATKDDMALWAEKFLNPQLVRTLDSLWGRHERNELPAPLSHYINPLFGRRNKYTNQKVITSDHLDLTKSLKEEFAKTREIKLTTGDSPIDIQPRSIDVGTPAANMGSYTEVNRSYISDNNAANADGTITTVNLYVYGYATDDFYVGMLYNTSGSDYYCREGSGDLGVFSGGLQQATGLDLSVVTGDLIGYYCTSVSTGTRCIDKETTGYNANYYVAGVNGMDTDDEETYGTTEVGDTLALDGVGTEAGGEAYPQSSSVTLGTSLSVERVGVLSRTSLPTLGTGLSVSKGIVASRSSSNAMGFSATVSRAITATRESLNIMGLSASVLRNFGFSSAVTLGLKVYSVFRERIKRLVLVFSAEGFPYDFPFYFAQNRKTKQVGDNRELSSVGTDRIVRSK